MSGGTRQRSRRLRAIGCGAIVALALLAYLLAALLKPEWFQ